MKKYRLPPECDFVIFENPVSIFYLTGVRLSTGKLIVGKEKTALFVDGRYLGSAKKEFAQTFFLNAENIQKFMHSAKSDVRIGFESDYLSYQRAQCLQSNCRQIFPHAAFVPLNAPLKELRMQKTVEEIAFMKEAASIAYRGWQHVQQVLSQKMSEKDIAWEFEEFCRKHGAEALSFETIVAIGKNSANPHHIPTDIHLEEETILLFDCGVKYKNYCSDMTRVIFLSDPNPTLVQCYAIVKKAFDAGLKKCKEGVAIAEIDNAVKKVIEEHGYGDKFVHATGHGVGLNVHESPKISSAKEDSEIVLKEGMVFTIEPGIYLEEIGGVRYEDTVVVTKNGVENFYPPEKI